MKKGYLKGLCPKLPAMVAVVWISSGFGCEQPQWFISNAERFRQTGALSAELQSYRARTERDEIRQCFDALDCENLKGLSQEVNRISDVLLRSSLDLVLQEGVSSLELMRVQMRMNEELLRPIDSSAGSWFVSTSFFRRLQEILLNKAERSAVERERRLMALEDTLEREARERAVLEATLEARFRGVNDRVDHNEARISDHENRFSGHEIRINSHSAFMDALQTNLELFRPEFWPHADTPAWYTHGTVRCTCSGVYLIFHRGFVDYPRRL